MSSDSWTSTTSKGPYFFRKMENDGLKGEEVSTSDYNRAHPFQNEKSVHRVAKRSWRTMGKRSKRSTFTLWGTSRSRDGNPESLRPSIPMQNQDIEGGFEQAR